MTPAQYFADNNHVAARIWNGFDPTLREAAIAQAGRQIEHFLGATPEGEHQQNAVSEQALHILRTSGVALDHDNNRPDFIPPDGEAKSEEPAGSPNEICAAALAWIHGYSANGTRPRPAITLVRG